MYEIAVYFFSFASLLMVFLVLVLFLGMDKIKVTMVQYGYKDKVIPIWTFKFCNNVT